MTDAAPVLTPTALDEVPSVVSSLSHSFRSHKSRHLDFRRQQLKGLYNLVAENFSLISEALFKDLHKHKHEVELFETAIVLTEIVETLAKLKVCLSVCFLLLLLLSITLASCSFALAFLLP